MIQDRLSNNGKIKDDYRLEFIQQKSLKDTSLTEISPNLLNVAGFIN